MTGMPACIVMYCAKSDRRLHNSDAVVDISLGDQVDRTSKKYICEMML